MDKKEKIDFACVIHPLNLDLVATFDSGAKKRKISSMKKALEWMSPFFASYIAGIRSEKNNREIKGALVMLPLLPEQILSLPRGYLLDKLIKTGKFVQKLGAKIIGLEAYTSQIGRKGVLVQRALDISATTGSSYAIAIAKNSIVQIAQKLDIDFKKTKMAIVGATGTIGRICSQIFSKKINYLCLIARNEQRLKKLANSLIGNLAEISITTNVSQGIKDADIIITATNTPEALIDVSILKPGTVIYDISTPKNVSQEAAESRKDILVIDGGIVRPPGNPDFHFYFGLPPGLCYACMAETMILAFEEKYESYSLGGNITQEKVEEIEYMGEKHGFKIDRLRGFGREISKERIDKLRKVRKK